MRLLGERPLDLLLAGDPAANQKLAQGYYPSRFLDGRQPFRRHATLTTTPLFLRQGHERLPSRAVGPPLLKFDPVGANATEFGEVAPPVACPASPSLQGNHRSQVAPACQRQSRPRRSGYTRIGVTLGDGPA